MDRSGGGPAPSEEWARAPAEHAGVDGRVEAEYSWVAARLPSGITACEPRTAAEYLFLTHTARGYIFALPDGAVNAA